MISLRKTKLFLICLIVAVLFMSFGVYAATMYNAGDIKYKDITVENALNELYQKNEKKSGELFLDFAKSTELKITHNYKNGYTGFLKLFNLDFSNIKSFTYSWNVDPNYEEYQYIVFENGDTSEEIKKTLKTETVTLNINGLSNVKIAMLASQDASNSFKVVSYTTMDGKVHK